MQLTSTTRRKLLCNLRLVVDEDDRHSMHDDDEAKETIHGGKSGVNHWEPLSYATYIHCKTRIAVAILVLHDVLHVVTMMMMRPESEVRHVSTPGNLCHMYYCGMTGG